ncbi:hypothetical protein QQS21_010861 [Conoideocrella luteorostrata]|uniref:Aminoglycoside phosphotransferase domain-containing protein n=1 Tax=Conoideocrella luteorostrata TaxID=1105319 RepID=A0AAJ0CF77_9HYPO|nr:hypothetical protein QQS21_010861 [Conoideocrella luteorostrata]
MATHVRDSVKQIRENLWLIGDKAILHRSPAFVPEFSWKASDGSYYTISDVSVPAPSAGALPPDSIIRQVHDAGDASAVWSLGDAFLKVKLLQDRTGATRERVTLEWLAKRKLSFRVPRVLYHAQGDDRSYLIVSHIPGETLGAAWRDMEESEQEECVNCVTGIVKELSAWHGDAIAGVDGAELPESWLDVCRDPHDFTPDALRENCNELGMDCSTLIFAHNDLGPYNIIVNAQKRVVGIIDFEMAGYVPREWVRTKLDVSWGLDFAWSGVDSDDAALTEWRKRVAHQLGQEGFPEVTDMWKKWFKQRLASRG